MADDDEDFIFLIRLALQRAGIATPLITVHNGVELIDYLQSSHDLPGRKGNQSPSLIILDAHLRLLTGYQVLQWIRAQPKFVRIPVVMLTGSEIESQALIARKLGASEYHDKPFTMDALVDMVRDMHERLIRSETIGQKAAL